MAVPQISLKLVKSLMLEGYVRYKADDDGNGLGNIEEKLGQTPAALREIFAHPKIKGIRIKVPLFILIDDIEDDDVEEADNNEDVDIIEMVDDIEDLPELNTGVHFTLPLEAPVPVHIPKTQAELDEEIEAALQKVMARAEAMEVDLLR